MANKVIYQPSTGEFLIVPNGGSGGSGITSINALTGPSLTLATGNTGTDFTIAASAETITFNIPDSSASNRGLLNPTDWNTFNGKQAALGYTAANAAGQVFTGNISAPNLSGTNTGNVTLTTANGLSLSGQALSLALASSTTTGALDSTDWNTFNSKQAALMLGNVTTSTTGITFTGGTGAVVGSGLTINIENANTSQPGLLTSTDWNTFNNSVRLDGSNSPMTGFLYLVGAGTTGNQAVTFAQLQSAIVGLSWKAPAAAATLAPLPTYVYNNGSSGVGATITFLPGATPVIDGYTPVLNDRILVKNETGANQPYNGIYSVTTVGGSGISAVFTRTTDANTPASLIQATIRIENGSQASEAATQVTPATITIGTTNLVFQIGVVVVYTASGAGITAASGNIFTLLYDGVTVGINGSQQLYVPNGGIGNTQLASGILRSKLATGTANTVLINDGSGNIASSSVTPTTLAFLDATSSVQTQLNTKAALAGAAFTGQVVEVPIAITTGSTMTVTAGSGNTFDIPLSVASTNLTFSGGSDGQSIKLRIKQSSSGNNTIIWPVNVKFGTDIPTVTLSTTANTVDYVGLLYKAATSTYDLVSFVRGY